MYAYDLGFVLRQSGFRGLRVSPAEMLQSEMSDVPCRFLHSAYLLIIGYDKLLRMPPVTSR